MDKNGNPIPQQMRIYSERRSSKTATQVNEYPKGTAFAQHNLRFFRNDSSSSPPISFGSKNSVLNIPIRQTDLSDYLLKIVKLL
jgi:hypothetical protein